MSLRTLFIRQCRNCVNLTMFVKLFRNLKNSRTCPGSREPKGLAACPKRKTETNQNHFGYMKSVSNLVGVVGLEPTTNGL